MNPLRRRWLTAADTSVWAFALAAGLTLLTRLPLLSTSSFGVDPDAWRIVAAGAHLAENGVYVVSRFPGYPLVELVAAGLWSMGIATPLAFGLATALMSAVGAGAMALLLRSWGVRHAVLGAVAAAMVPVVLVESVTAMDYIWAASLGVVSLTLAQRGRWVWAAIALGLAIGCRPTAVLMAVPVAILVADANRPAVVVQLLAIAAAVALAAWLPVLVTYGLDFVHAAPGRVAFIDVIRMATTGTWGLLGIVALALALVWIDRGRVHERRVEVMALLGGLLLYGALYFGMPLQSGYLIPAVLLVVPLLALVLPPKRFVVVCALLVASPLVLDVKGERTITVDALGSVSITEGVVLTGAGPVFHRRTYNRYVANRGAALLEATDALTTDEVAAVGPMQAVIVVTALREGRQPPSGLTTVWPPRTDPMSRTGDTAWLPPPPAEPATIYCVDRVLVQEDFACIPLLTDF